LAAERPRLSLKIDIGKLLAIVVAQDTLLVRVRD
jgi:hypothetical protein